MNKIGTKHQDEGGLPVRTYTVKRCKVAGQPGEFRGYTIEVSPPLLMFVEGEDQRQPLIIRFQGWYTSEVQAEQRAQELSWESDSFDKTSRSSW